MTLTHGARVVYRPYGWFATHLGPADCGVRIRWDNGAETVVNPHTLDVWPHPVTLVPRAEVRRIYTDHGVPPFPQIDGDGVIDLICVELSARDSREMAEDSDNALRLTAIADDLDELVARYARVQTDDPDGGVNVDLSADHSFRSLDGASRCVAIVGPLNSGQACGLSPEAHQPSTVTGSSLSLEER